MDVLVLYDIHGNVDALDAVLADPRAAAPDAVLVGGDTIPGAFATAALDRIEGLAVPVHRVRGNGERETADAIGAPAPDPEDALRVCAAHTLREIGPRRARTLAAAPTTVELDGVRYCHATLGSDEAIVTKLSPSERWAAAFGGARDGLVVCGHTHQQDDRAIGDVRVVNAGSVGLPYEGDAAARWLWVSDGRPELRRTPYDAAAAGRRMLAAGWPDERSVMAALVDPVDPLVVTRIFEERASAPS